MLIARMCGILLLVVLAAGSIAVQAQERAGTEAYVRRMTEATVMAWPMLAKMFETTQVFADVQLLVSDGQRAWLMNARGGQELDMPAVEALGLAFEYRRFEKIEWQGRPAVFIGLGRDLPEVELQRLKHPEAVPELFDLATHEAFHFYAEDDWARGPLSERSTLYPAVVEPRLYRNRVIRHLLAATRGELDALGRASYWYRRWLNEFADEAERIRDTDRTEGSARYVESVAQLLAMGLEPRSPEWEARLLRQLSPLGRADYLAVDHESYTLGLLAGYLLDRRRLDWLPRVAQGETPLGLLLGPVAPISDSPDELLGRRIQESLDGVNDQAAELLEPFLQRFNDPASRHLLVPGTAMKGSFGSGHSFRLAGMAETIETGVDALFALKGGRIGFRAATVATQVKASCGRKDLYWLLALTEADFQGGAHGRLRVRRDGLDVDIPYPARAIDSPRSWCVQV
ncbi:hypothetical protein [Pseudomonas sp. MWU13-2105]|uniref:hypothetical protein n=1 Tax=Pseudomonas sp. MWU13-2105 TaxID=2935074 RepID=UPI00200E0CCF|nr:hypothetical protein [Pseudomonas sp. MWU13-2105]